MNDRTKFLSSRPRMETWLRSFFLVAGCCFALFANAAVKYVKPTGSDSNSGNSWAQAYQTLQKAIEATVAGDQIWLAAGTYYPTKDNTGGNPGNGQLRTFFINKNIAIYGGFNGTESSLSQRNWRTNIAILSGDVGTVGDDADNAYHVVYIQGVSAAMRLDGVAVTKGNANGGDANDFINPVVNGIGGGVLVYATGGVTSAPTITNCRIYDNRASGGGGAGAASKGSGSSTPTFTNCLFENNIASGLGGAVFSMADGDFGGGAPLSIPIFEHCTFYNNNASGTKKVGYSLALQGGGSTAHFVKCILWGDPTGDYLGVASFSAVRLENSLSKGGCTFGINCVGTILNTNPLFVNAAGGDLRLAAGSPAIDGPAGEYYTSAPTEKDYDNNNRPIGCYDYGAFESATSTATVVTCYQDMDDDGYGIPGVTKQFCTTCGEGWADNTLDCDDNQNADLPYSLNQSGAFNPVSGTGTSVTLTDEQVSGALPIGFTFNFFGNNYTDFWIGSNGFIAFESSPAGCCSGQSIPNPNTPNNLIALAWDNLNPAAGGSINYFTTGTAPNRKLIVNYVGIRVAGGSSPNVTSQVILYETSNLIEIHSADINGVDPATMGIENATGTIAFAVPGRNRASWSATNDYVAFVPVTAVQIITTFYRDMDGDGFGNPAVTQQGCSQPLGYVANSSDCNDNNFNIKPGATEVCDGVDNNCDGATDEGLAATWYRDMDSDGFGNLAVTQMSCTQPSGYVANSTDCDDNNFNIKPSATEVCDGVDNDCDGSIDEGVAPITWYRDMDSDGFGNLAVTQMACTQPSGYVANSTDCNDNNFNIKPGATEVCDGVDNNCNGATDEGVLTTWYRDMDGDTFGNPAMTQQACAQPTGYVANNTDCNDNNPLEKPGQVWYRDTDNDGYAQSGSALTQCSRPVGYKVAGELTATSGDCNDNASNVNPGATEICDGQDNNCNTLTDENVTNLYYRDMDGDGFGNPLNTQAGCTAPTGYVANDDDCNDNNAAIKPGATELCDGVDNNCNGATDEGCNPDYTITTTGNAIVITDVSGNGETLTVSQSGSNIRFVVTPTTRTYSLNGGFPIAFTTPADVVLAGATSITVNTAAGNDIINIGAFTANLPSLTVNGGTGDDTVNFNGDINFVANANLNLDMQNDHASPGVDQISLSSNANLILTGMGEATLKVSRSLFVGSGGSLKTENGNLTLEANQQATSATGNFLGIHLDGSLVECTGSGELTLKGKGGNTSAGKYGILLINAAQVKGGTGATSITGAGGNTSGTAGADNIGVLVRNSQITSSGGGVTVNGTGGGSGSSSVNYGVYIDGTGEITAGGMGSVSVTGTGGNTTGNFNAGVAVATTGAKITSSGGNVTVIGTGNGNGSSLLDYGVVVQGGGEITAGGAGTVTVEGQGGNAQTNSSTGVVISTNGKISSSAGAVYVEGTGGGSAIDIQIQSGGTITSTSATAGITLNSINSGTSPNASGADVSTTGTQKTTFSAGSKLNIDIDGLTANTQYQQLGVVGMIDLNSASLTFTGSALTPAGGNTFTIVDNDGTDPVLGTFNGLAEGASIPNFLNSGLSARITYVGGTGNDVVLTVINNVVCYADTDEDGYGDPNSSMTFSGTCGVGYVSDNTDCDDTDPLEFPGQEWYKDADGDDYSDGTTLTQCLRPMNYFVANELIATSGDCNDAVAAINPAASEICDGIDNNCNGSTDEGVQTTYYRDLDGDTFGDPANTTMACSLPTGYVTNNTDCNDNDALEFPGQVWFKDADGDDYSDGTTLTQCLRPINYFIENELIETSGDCNDAVAAINPAATEICDGIDNDCDGMIDNGALTTYYQDSDEDGFGNPAASQQACSPPIGYVTNNTDCDDTDEFEFPGQVWYKDVDGDGYSDGTTLTQCLRPANYYIETELIATTGDCNDAVAAINPAATEICDEIDNDCDGMTDEGVQTTYYEDTDMDGFGDPNSFTMACSVPTGYVTNNTDCDDNDALEFPGQVWYKDADGDDYSDGATLAQCLRPTNYFVAAELIATSGDCNDAVAAINPAATEICDEIDNDCDGSTDEGLTFTTYYTDADGDGYGTGAGQSLCANPGAGFATQAGDCNDNNDDINPGATEICDGIDNDCDGSTDEGVLTTYYRDLDGDTFGDPANTTTACSLPTGYVTNNTDCDDTDPLEKPGQTWYADADNDGYSTGIFLVQCLRPAGFKVAAELTATIGDCNDSNAAINPAATEVCDGVDNDCDGQIDNGTLNTYYRDMDGDGFGNPSNTTMACSLPTGYVTNNTDCDDNDALEKPGQVWYKDADGDDYSDGTTLTQCLRPTNYFVAAELIATSGDCNDAVAAINPAATEICDGIDNNCNGSTDEGVQTTYYRDMDGDGFGNPSNTTLACSLPSGYVTNNTDCDDNDALEKPGQVWYADVDNDGYSNGTTLTQCLRPAGYKVPAELTATTGDCNDNAAAINPAATEICDGIDNDCDGQIDDGVLNTYYRDMDGDGFGNPANTTMACSLPTGYVTNNTDCDDNDALEKPGQVWYADVDNDGYSTGSTLTQCLRPVGYKVAAELNATSGDCNDNAAAINPAATEICDGIDNNCNGSTDEGVQTTYYRDMDGDGFGNPSNTTLACSLPSGYVTNNTDCNDNSVLEKPGQVWFKDTDNDGYSNGATLTQCLRPAGYKVPAELTATTGDCNDNNASIKPGALEICDGMDNDCDGQTDEGVKTEYFADTDGDGFGDPNNTITECSQPQGYVTNSEDCDDTDDEVNPSEEEVCDDKDNDCNGTVDDIGGTTAGNWTSGDVGGANGGANFPPCNAEPTDVFTINATGFSTSSSDKLHAVYQELCGNGEIIARVLNVQNGGWAGIMLRETLDPGSKKVSIKTQLTPMIRREIRSMTNGAASILNFNRPQHVWLRLVRDGSNFTGFTSIDGNNWGFAFAATISMNGCIYAGLFSESINASVTTIATFDNVSIFRATSNLSVPGAQAATSLDGQMPELSAEVYPNPTEGRVTISFSNVTENRVTIRVFNSLGEQVIQKQVMTMNEATESLDLSDMADGMYTLRIEVPGQLATTKRIVLAKASGLRN